MENNRFDLLPSPVQGKGFLRMYADFLDLPADPLIKAWETGTVEVVELFDMTENGAADAAEDVFYLEPETTDTPEPEQAAKVEKPQAAGKQKAAPTVTPRSAEVFNQVGDKLRRQREALGLSLNDIEQYTHIRQFYLKSIETGRIDELPSPVQAKGMIQSYAQFLDMNSDELLLTYAEGLQTQRKEKLGAASVAMKPRQQYRSEKQTNARRFLTPDLLVGSFVILMLVAFAVWSTIRVIARQNETAQTPIPGISEVLASTASPTNAAESATLASTAVETASEAPAAESTPPPAAPDTTEAGEPTSPTIVSIDDAPLQVYVVARQRTYLKVIVDGKIEFDGRVLPGNAYPFSGEDAIELVSGNAAALQIFFNQVDLGTIGSFGQVINLIFEQQGVVTPTAQFTSTATPTIQATITLEPTATPETPTVTPFIP